jgi:hypothetical protein
MGIWVGLMLSPPLCYELLTQLEEFRLSVLSIAPRPASHLGRMMRVLLNCVKPSLRHGA